MSRRGATAAPAAPAAASGLIHVVGSQALARRRLARRSKPGKVQPVAPPSRDGNISLGGGFGSLPLPALRQLQEDVACWDEPGAWQLDPNPAAWMGAKWYGFFGKGKPMGRVRDAKRFSLDASELHHLPHRPYSWDASPQCRAPLRQFNRAAFCAALGGRSLLLVGDSLTAGLHDALVELMGRVHTRYEQPTGDYCAQRLPPGSPCGGHNFCNGTVRVVLRRNDYLIFDTPGRTETQFLVQGAGGRLRRHPSSHIQGVEGFPGRFLLSIDDLWPLDSSTPRGQYDIVVINRGAHYVQTATVKAELDRALGFLLRGGSERGPPPPAAWRPPLVIYRSATFGHANCKRASLPLDPWTETRKQSSGGAARGCWYQWCQVSAQNAGVRSFLASRYPSVVWMDVEKATTLRPDMHTRPTDVGSKLPAALRKKRQPDCLHYQGMGAYDHWARLLFNVVALVGQRAAAGGAV